MGEAARKSGRPPRPRVDPWEPLDLLLEEEPDGRGGTELALTTFLAGAECPFQCVFCDLWRHTIPEPTPPGAIPRQLEITLQRLARGLPHPDGSGRRVGRSADVARIKLYNASNFFDNRAVPASEDCRILELLEPFREVTVECHPRLVGDRALRFADGLRGRLEVAMGLETVHPDAFPRLEKGMTLGDFEEATETLRRRGLGVRAFVLVGAPFVPPVDAVEWAVRSARWAVERGAERVSLIPVRGETAQMKRLEQAGDWTPPALEQVEAALEETLRSLPETRDDETPRIVTVDPWDLEIFSRCPACLPRRRERLERMNLFGRLEPPVACPLCAEA